MNKWTRVKLGEVLSRHNSAVATEHLTEVNLAGVYGFGEGLFKRGPMAPGKTTYKTYNRLSTDDFVISTPKAWEGALALVAPEFDGWFLSPVFPTFRVDRERLLPKFLEWYCKREAVWGELQQKSRGIGARRESVHPEQFLSLEIPLPSLADQRRAVARIEELNAQIQKARTVRRQAAEEAEAFYPQIRDKVFRDLKCERRLIGDVFILVNGRAFKPTDWQPTGRQIIRIQNLKYSNASYNRYSGEVDPNHIGQVYGAIRRVSPSTRRLPRRSKAEKAERPADDSYVGRRSKAAKPSGIW